MAASARQCRADRTWSQYQPQFEAWVAFCQQHSAPAVGADPEVAAAFLTETRLSAARRGVGPQAVERASAAVSLLHEMAGKPSPCASPMCARVREEARRTLAAQPSNTAATNPGEQPVASPEDIRALVDKHIHPSTPLAVRMTVTGAVLCYAGLLRFDDLAHVLVHEDLLRILPDRAEIFLFKGKTDQAARGTLVTIGRVDGPYCPVALLETLLLQGQYQRQAAVRPKRGGAPGTWEDAEDVGPLLRAVTRTGTLAQVSVRLPAVIKPLTYHTFRKRLNELWAAAGVTRSLPPHALRRGGATAAVANGADRMEVQKLGRWRSQQVFEFAYVREDAARKQRLTSYLGLGATRLQG
ncbi:hypothetical protein CHLRE_17g716900v5 [Chlamydomonas reinhardtii]|uniref:Tyr recombinase domain-containing protein n=1 Tax=Chlamydomonas reinhardtii TaxID=3055 RepID=A0A2K3CQ09_CHLRE|nr:uncharacterized protein CHLRE_17g716900v5 [Chlamydomonas reinhardtii]PNW70369.1 hypothetical protein CHLRE_17g716900v5 [Chlamydomonas reinhardtii]